MKRALRISSTLALLVVSLSIVWGASPSPEPRPNFWGVWMGMARVAWADPRFTNTPFLPTPEFTALGAAESERQASSNTPGECDVWGPVGFMASSLFPLQILEGSNQIVMLMEATLQPRRIYTDGRGHPSDWDATFLGHSIGHWEGDTLVVDTIGTNGRSRPMNGYVSGSVLSRGDGADVEKRLPASEQLHLIERLRLVGEGEYLENEVTVIDPKIYLKPMTSKRYFQRRPDIDVQEYVCNDNNRREEEGQDRGDK
jgi:hypothetical protein